MHYRFACPVILAHAMSMYVHSDEAKAAIAEGMKQLEVLQRQTILSQLYPSARSVME